MRRLFADMDLYKFIILASVVLIPAALAFVWWTDEQVRMARVAISDATKSNGELEQIGALQKRLQVLKSNKLRGQQHSQPRTYFRGQILRHTLQGLGANDLEIKPQAPRPVPGKRTAEDVEVDILFNKDGKKDFPLPREFIHMVIHNCETGSQVWKLRKLQIRNDGVPKRLQEAPPKTTEKDLWQVQKLTFARRQPASRKR